MSRTGACGMERLHGEWLLLACCDGADDHRCVSRAGPSGIGHVFIRNGHWPRIGRFLLEKGIVGVSLEGIVDYPDINTFFGHQLSVAFEFQLGLPHVAFCGR